MKNPTADPPKKGIIARFKQKRNQKKRDKAMDQNDLKKLFVEKSKRPRKVRKTRKRIRKAMDQNDLKKLF